MIQFHVCSVEYLVLLGHETRVLQQRNALNVLGLNIHLHVLLINLVTFPYAMIIAVRF